MIFLVEGFKFVVLRREPTLGGCVHDKQHLVGILFEGNGASLSVLDSEIINCFHFSFW